MKLINQFLKSVMSFKSGRDIYMTTHNQFYASSLLKVFVCIFITNYLYTHIIIILTLHNSMIFTLQ